MTTRQKLVTGSMLTTVSIAGIFLSLLLGWSKISSPWDFFLGFVLGVSAGTGAALAVWGLFELKSGD